MKRKTFLIERYPSAEHHYAVLVLSQNTFVDRDFIYFFFLSLDTLASFTFTAFFFLSVAVWLQCLAL